MTSAAKVSDYFSVRVTNALSAEGIFTMDQLMSWPTSKTLKIGKASMNEIRIVLETYKQDLEYAHKLGMNRDRCGVCGAPTAFCSCYAEQKEFKPVIERSMCCSTAHITKKDSELLNNPLCPISVDEYEYGCYVHTGWYLGTDDKDSLPLEREQDMSSFGFSAEFIWLVALAYAANCKYLVLDCDGPVYEQLPSFSW